MPSPSPRHALSLDSLQMERLLADLHGGDKVAGTVQLRMRYLQRNGFPHGRDRGSRRLYYSLPDVVRVLIVFDLLDMEVSPQRAVATVDQSWDDLARSVVPCWRALRGIQEDGREVAEFDALRTMAIVQPLALRVDLGGLQVGLLRPSALTQLLTAGRGLRAAIVVDLFGLVDTLDQRLRGEAFGLKPAEIDASFERWGEEAFGTPSPWDWKPPAD